MKKTTQYINISKKKLNNFYPQIISTINNTATLPKLYVIVNPNITQHK